MRTFFFGVMAIIISVIFGTFYVIKNAEIKFKHPVIKIGAVLPVGGDELEKISKYKFYILLMDKENTFPKKYSWGLEEIITEKIGGLIERADSSNPLFSEIFGLHRDKNKRIFSMILITDRNARIVGIYPNKKLSELVDVLQLHPHLIDLSLAGTAL